MFCEWIITILVEKINSIDIFVNMDYSKHVAKLEKFIRKCNEGELLFLCRFREPAGGASRQRRKQDRRS